MKALVLVTGSQTKMNPVVIVKVPNTMHKMHTAVLETTEEGRKELGVLVLLVTEEDSCHCSQST